MLFGASASLRSDGIPVRTVPTILSEFEANRVNAYPFKPFSTAFVKKALDEGVDWVAKGAVTPAKECARRPDVF